MLWLFTCLNSCDFSANSTLKRWPPTLPVRFQHLWYMLLSSLAKTGTSDTPAWPLPPNPAPPSAPLFLPPRGQNHHMKLGPGLCASHIIKMRNWTLLLLLTCFSWNHSSVLRWQPTRSHRPWFSSKNTGVGCYCLLQCMKHPRNLRSYSLTV